MPYCRSLGSGLWEVRSDMTNRKIGRVVFCVIQGLMCLAPQFNQEDPEDATEGHSAGFETNKGSGVKNGAKEEERETWNVS